MMILLHIYSMQQYLVQYNNFISQNSFSLSLKKTRTPFKPEEDEKLRDLVFKYGENEWSTIASLMEGRSVRQCRERWQNNLNEGVVKSKWSIEEDELLKEKYDELGPSWKVMEKFFPGRTSYNIRNRWHGLTRFSKKTKKSKLSTMLSNQQNFELNESDKGESNNPSNLRFEGNTDLVKIETDQEKITNQINPFGKSFIIPQIMSLQKPNATHIENINNDITNCSDKSFTNSTNLNIDNNNNLDNVSSLFNQVNTYQSEVDNTYDYTFDEFIDNSFDDAMIFFEQDNADQPDCYGLSCY
ncbi:DNA-binding protein eta2 [Tritrichomonas foetus]|uniref:DNA-binding protein eta2 n=1 Tax=Tritrichomonas foetus TaxID=1144522 RepID=A0A1J4KQE9_9EUKA|nr:DNA-binding protein eta2 [Tritrichomonas foetus]|eukprot:OHT11661.1 DNA-binding protein eta2 [Tritrichomonas foetus]